MPALLPLLLSGAFIGAVVRWVLATIGVGIVSIIGLGALLTALGNYLNNMVAVPPVAADAVCNMQVAGVIQLILSAYAIRVAISAGKRLRVL
jgi:hypothetical protein